MSNTLKFCIAVLVVHLAITCQRGTCADAPKKTRVLLTGASGFGGSHALRHLLINTDWDIVCPVSFLHRGLPERLVVAVGKDGEANGWWDRITVIKYDLSCSIDDISEKRVGIVDYIINYASESSVDRSITNPVPFIKNNVDLILNVLELARIVNPKAVLVISTDEVYGPALNQARHEEWSSIIPSNPYAASKAAQEAIAISYWRTYGLPLIIVNCMNLIGETQDPEKLVPLVISRVMRSEEVPIFASTDANGEMVSIGSRFYLHARNLADAVLFLIKRGSVSLYSEEAHKPDRWNVVGSHEMDNLEMAKLIAQFVGKPLKYKLVDFHKTRPGHDPRYALDGTKIQNAGWAAPTEFQESLKRLVNWTIQNPIWASRISKEVDFDVRPNNVKSEL